ncbi:hypothetical protein KAFR_0B06940 [Kazachstania africana CBS 2517]|uniref:Mitochondrial genome maintenance protein MGM101 n=1 Tax=Kazachstania africana (strain ATCC 22294 / BCRC 22015 / CBS 2517 / CECT 1963 / NBRC 1671 / NRRL Y-8276) TaxID=1071382 RepID=H2ARJ1_KAZAF|nr:hypothetical protein KAFR_0B06940 [Kazachstania africana CBS 2517]CCF56991.1 hypothetical protein KAFR_0B06940 [Kazachstania africana CBS 2517]
MLVKRIINGSRLCVFFNPVRTIVSNSAAAPIAATTTPVKKTIVSKSSTSTKSSSLGYSTNLTKSLNGNALGKKKVLAEDGTELMHEAENIARRSGVSQCFEIDWYQSWHGLGVQPFEAKVQKELLKELDAKDIEIKPDGLIYLPEIKYRRILNKAFGAGGWGLVPRSETIVTKSLVTREYGLICHGQLVGVARGEQDYFNENGIPTATEGCKSNALMRCCKDLGIGSELWDPVFIKQFKETNCVEKFVEHITTKKKKKIWLRKDRKVEYPYK